MSENTIDDLIAAPKRDGKLPELGRFGTLRKRHADLVEELAKANERREEILGQLTRAHKKVRDLRARIARSSKQLDLERKLQAQPNTMHDDKI